MNGRANGKTREGKGNTERRTKRNERLQGEAKKTREPTMTGRRQTKRESGS